MTERLMYPLTLTLSHAGEREIEMKDERGGGVLK
jgi:hypothetical protein